MQFPRPSSIVLFVLMTLFAHAIPSESRAAEGAVDARPAAATAALSAFAVPSYAP